jgi:protein-L-isoaspartate(D-aspartate) O-methyltransferase
MAAVDRSRFVERSLAENAYDDNPLPIGFGQTVSQPYIVALTLELARLRPADRLLEVGTGCGYQAAVASRIAACVRSVEIVPELAEAAGERLRRLGYDNVAVRCGDGREGWPTEAPFDAIIVAAATRRVPPALEAQLADGGRIVIPVGDRGGQTLLLGEKGGDCVDYRMMADVRFVPLVGAD